MIQSGIRVYLFSVNFKLSILGNIKMGFSSFSVHDTNPNPLHKLGSIR